MQTVSFDLANLEKRLRAKQFRIPQFQRAFTWNESQVKLVIDSIARNYPIGSLLVLPESPNNPHLYSRAIDAVIKDTDNDKDLQYLEIDDSDDDSHAEVYYILDGQQRLTSIARVFLNANSRKNYYFDLKRMLKEFDHEGTTWIIARQKRQNDPERRDKNRLLRTDVVLDQQKADIYVSEYIEDSDDFPEFKNNRTEGRKAAAKIKGIFETIRKYQIPVVVLDRDSGVESVCRVFETINSTGTRLTTFDLAVARFYPNPDLRELWKQTEEKHPILGESQFNVDGERILQVLSLWNAKEKGTAFETTRASLLALDRDFIATKWAIAADKLAQAYEWAKNENGARPDTLPNDAILVSIAAFMVLYPQIVDYPLSNFRSVLKRWFFSSILQQGAAKATNYRIGEDFNMLVAYGDTGLTLKTPDVHLTAESLVKINKRDNRFKALQCLMAMSAKEDLISGKMLNHDVEDHHIFPRSLTKQGHDLLVNELDSVANRLAVSPDTNRKLSDMLPETYFLDLQIKSKRDGTIPDVNRRLTGCLIPGNITNDTFAKQFNVDNFRVFLQER